MHFLINGITKILYIYIYIGWVQVTHGITLNNVTPLNNLLWNSSFKNLTVNLHVLHVLNIHANFHTNRILFTIRSINSFYI